MEIQPIQTKADYRAALKVVEGLMDAKVNTLEGDRLAALVTLIEAYEHQCVPMAPLEAINVLKF